VAANDKSKRAYLRNRGWRLLEVWEHEIRGQLDDVVVKLRALV
jgi:very-short-patch-repair endonuclease